MHDESPGGIAVKDRALAHWTDHRNFPYLSAPSARGLNMKDRCFFCQKTKSDVAYSKHFDMDLCRSCWELQFDAMKKDEIRNRAPRGIWRRTVRTYIDAAKDFWGLK